MKLFAGNDNNIDLLNLQTEDGTYITDATITCVVTDPNGVQIGTTITLAYLGAGFAVGSYADGNYRGVLPASANPVAGTTYKLAYSSSNYGFAMNVYAPCVERTG